MNSFLVGSAVYLFLTLAGVPWPFREIITGVSWLLEAWGNFQEMKMRKIKSMVIQR